MEVKRSTLLSFLLESVDFASLVTNYGINVHSAVHGI